MNKKVGHVSASSIAAFKACPTRYRLAYVEALRPAQEAQPLRMGTAWHKGLEVLETPDMISVDPGPEGTGVERPATDEEQLETAVELACLVYETIPDWADPTDWAIEREIVANALAAYHWLYGSESEYETVATELEFDLPLVNPETDHSTPNFRRVGKIDRIIRHKVSGQLLIQENKSTSKPIDSGSTYWDRLRKDTQSKFYILAARDMQQNQDLAEVGLHIEDVTAGNLVAGLLHDVFHKPSIRPKKLTQADSKKFVADGEYCGQQFELGTDGPDECPDLCLTVDGAVIEIEYGVVPKPLKDGTQKPTPFAIRETPGMYGARLLQDMTERPEFYFARREVPFTDQELEAFKYQIWALQKNMNEMERTGFYWENEAQCEATFKCAYCVLCYNNVSCYDGVTVPPGFKRLRTEDVEQVDPGEEE